MKKILTILGTLALITTASASVISCGQQTQEQQGEIEVNPDDLSSIITVTDLGLIKDSEVVGSDFFHVALKLLQQKNPLVKAEIIDHLTNGFLNIYKVDGENVSINLIPEVGFNKVIGKVTINFIVEQSSQLSLIDVKNLEHKLIGEIVLQQGVKKANNQQILNGFLLSNPNFEKDRENFKVVSVEDNLIENGNTFIAKITINENNKNYNFRFANYLKILFGVRESDDNELGSFVKTWKLGQIKDSDVVDGNYIDKVLELLVKRNPSFTNEMKNSLVPKKLNTFIVNGSDVTIIFVSKPGLNQFDGQITIGFQVGSSSKLPSLIDAEKLKHDLLVGIKFELGTSGPTDQEILDAFIAENPAYKKDKQNFSVVVANQPGPSENMYEATITYKSDNPQYDLRLTNSIKVTYRDSIAYAIGDLSSIIKVTELGLIKDDDAKNGWYYTKIMEIAKFKNPELEEIESELVIKDINPFHSDGLNVSITFIPGYGYDDIWGEVTFTFQLEATESGGKGSIFDKKYFLNDDLGEILVEDVYDNENYEEVTSKILDALSKTNPVIRKLIDEVPTIIEHIDGWWGNSDELRIFYKFDLKDTDYDIRLGNIIGFWFSIKQI